MRDFISKTDKLNFVEPSLRKQYLKSLYFKLLVGLLFFLSILIVSIISIKTGSINISIVEIYRAFFTETENSYVIWNLRFTRVVAAILAGASLGVTGAVMQNVLRNPLASPFTLGVSQGAAFGAAFAIIVFGAGQTHYYGNEAVTVFNRYLIIISALVGALLTVILILFLSFLRNITPEAIILAGVAISSLFGAATMFLQYFASDFQVAATVFWTFGDLGKAGWVENKLMFIALSFSLIFFFLNRWNYNALLWGDEVAESLGVNTKFLRISSMFMSAFVVSVCTSFLGIIGFIGLISPHIVRIIVGNDYRFLIPYSALCGATILCISDLISRTIIAPEIIPVGIVTSLAGAPVFFYLLLKWRRI
ncbi:MAG: iron ABC transporter permease [Thermodesulfovibrio sp.]|nr:iron ABC transporter permease [Thermodesulfovibrio sp.]MCX7724803.1 iron ABC transporter permease [Thermodesulfovibrio sp.]